MGWTKNVPTEPGHYWFYGVTGKQFPHTIEDYTIYLIKGNRGNTKIHFVNLSLGGFFYPHMAKGYYSDPLPDPGEFPTEEA
jgi:hypothetical protein